MGGINSFNLHFLHMARRLTVLVATQVFVINSFEDVSPATNRDLSTDCSAVSMYQFMEVYKQIVDTKVQNVKLETLVSTLTKRIDKLESELQTERSERISNQNQHKLSNLPIENSSNSEFIGFHAYYNLKTDILNTGVVKFEEVSTNPQNGYVFSTGIFTVPKKGIYQIYSSLMLCGKSVYMILKQRKHGGLDESRLATGHRWNQACQSTSVSIVKEFNVG